MCYYLLVIQKPINYWQALRDAAYPRAVAEEIKKRLKTYP